MKKSRIVVFIQPPIEDFYITSIRRQPLGLLYLASIAEKQGWKVKLINAHSSNRTLLPLPQEMNYLEPFIKSKNFPFSYYAHWGMSWQALEKEIKEIRNVDLFAISALFTPYFEEVDKVIELVKKYHPNAFIAVGGGHATLYPDYYLSEKKVHFVVKGEGEIAFQSILFFIETHQTTYLGLDSILTPFFIGEKNVSQVFSLDMLPFPQRDLLKERDFRFYKKRGVSLLFSRGCPHSCRFCSSRFLFYWGYRTRSIENLIQEIEFCIEKYGIQWFNFEDDNLFADPQISKELLKALIDYQKKKSYFFEITAMNGISIENIDEEILLLMQKSGFREINISLVSSSFVTQNSYRRPFDTIHFQKVIKTAQKIGLKCRVYFILGLPEQTKEEIYAIAKWADENKVMVFPSVYYDVFNKKKHEWKIQRSSAFPNETKYFSRKDLIDIFFMYMYKNKNF